MVKVRMHRAVIYSTGSRFSRKKTEEYVDAVARQARIRAMIGPYTTGHMASTITTHVYVAGFKVHGSVGTATTYGHLVNSGTRPHVIRPRQMNGTLRFYWRKVGRVVYFKKVNHPGQAAKGWLTIPARNEAIKKGWKVLIHD
jgi:hypothetical protein